MVIPVPGRPRLGRLAQPVADCVVAVMEVAPAGIVRRRQPVERIVGVLDLRSLGYG